MRQRWYDPQLQRFVSKDPIGLKGGVNLYTYVNQDPINWVDPEGLKFTVQGDKNAASLLLYQLEKYTGLDLAYRPDRSLKILGSQCPGNNAARLLKGITDSPVSITVNASDKYPPNTLSGKYFTGQSGIQDIYTHFINEIATVDQGVAGSILFHEIGEAFSRSLFHQGPAIQEDARSEAGYKRDHEGLACSFENLVLADFGMSKVGGPYTWKYAKGGSQFEIVPNHGTKRWPSPVYGKRKF